MKRFGWAVVAAVMLAGPVGAAEAPPPNAQMQRIFAEDQAARKTPPVVKTKADWDALVAADAARREATRALLADGKLKAAEDFYGAAFVFQHGREPNDHLMAHTLATVAVAKGHPKALWIAAATLDRYLQGVGQKQIYGTQYGKAGDEAAWTQEPYDRGLISDALRRELGVPVQADQAKRLEEIKAEAP